MAKPPSVSISGLERALRLAILFMTRSTSRTVAFMRARIVSSRL
jgi:hypothetical protein